MMETSFFMSSIQYIIIVSTEKNKDTYLQNGRMKNVLQTLGL